MNDTKIASKAKAQLSNFMGKVFTHFSKPTKRFIEECIYGIQAESFRLIEREPFSFITERASSAGRKIFTVGIDDCDYIIPASAIIPTAQTPPHARLRLALKPALFIFDPPGQASLPVPLNASFIRTFCAAVSAASDSLSDVFDFSAYSTNAANSR